jgi:hypothetical protein
MRRRRALQLLTAAAALAAGLPAQAATTVHFDDTITVAGDKLVLNGAGVRTKVFFKIYAVGLYLATQQTTTADVLAAPGARRVAITMLRDVSTEDFGKAFTDGLNANTDKDERTRFLAQTMQFGSVFGQIQTLKKGEQLLFDWLPGEGTQCYLNGKKIGGVIPERAFYNAVLRIWLGDKPADYALKLALLGAK